MNKKQIKVLWVVIIIVCLMALFPVRGSDNGERGRGFLFYETITAKSGERSMTFKAGVDLETLIAQMIPVIAVGTGLIITFKDKKTDKNNS